MMEKGTHFCTECRKETGYEIKEEQITHNIRGKEYNFVVNRAVCNECGEEINLPGLMDENAKRIDKQYRETEGLVSVEDIETLMDIYNIGKAPLSLALGFGEITITRYLQGQCPSVEYSNIIRKALTDVDFMVECLKGNKERIGDVAFKKSIEAAEDLKKLTNSVSEKMLITISYIFKKSGEITPLALQKLLYYVQAIFMISYNRPLFEDECQAWAHGPVFEKVYDMFKNFKYNVIDDNRFVIFRDSFQKLSDEEREVIDNVINSFGMYSGKTLERITHKEDPWIKAYNGGDAYIYTNETITKESIKKYFEKVAKHYDLKSEDGLKEYISAKLSS